MITEHYTTAKAIESLLTNLPRAVVLLGLLCVLMYLTHIVVDEGFVSFLIASSPCGIITILILYSDLPSIISYIPAIIFSILFSTAIGGSLINRYNMIEKGIKTPDNNGTR